MFLAPTGNPSSLRVGHPDVATEHTGLSPAYPPSLRAGGVVGAAVRQGCEPRATQFGKTVRGRGGGILGLGTAGNSPRMKIGFRVPHRRLARAHGSAIPS